jgi:hypothetical protein
METELKKRLNDAADEYAGITRMVNEVVGNSMARARLGKRSSETTIQVRPGPDTGDLINRLGRALVKAGVTPCESSWPKEVGPPEGWESRGYSSVPVTVKFEW